MNLQQANAVLSSAGCEIVRRDEAYGICVRDPKGNHLWLNDDDSDYLTIGANFEDGTLNTRPIEIHDGTSRVAATSFGMNDPTMNLRLLFTGGEPIPLSVLRGIYERFPRAGFVNTYGSTEGGPITTFLAPEDS